MTVGRSLRFQILRRDDFRCHYCGATAQQATLVVDHVLPAALGGTDTADNLVTSCADCNSGKAASPPDAALVVSVDQRNVEWANAIEQARAALYERERNKWEWFTTRWQGWKDEDGEPMPLDDNWEWLLQTWLERGLTKEIIADRIEKAMTARGVANVNTFRYFAGCCWQTLTAIEEEAIETRARTDAAKEDD